MPRFFDVNTQTLHVVASYAGAAKLPSNVVRDAIKVEEFEPSNINELHVTKLRRQYPGMSLPGFFSTDDKKIHTGNYDLTDKSNVDLVEIAKTVVYR
ncbi:peptidase [Legionella maioricensis]|uniref:Peptidase n=1 Tax=Legionella maioricensis TaxID=2896528 RepID=A0A9X2CZM5_9GAMM|nr:peptidase [Legionella maioricensis]MCL9683445.1 peptidase [Legionella maioricensis]MCL9688616.1 peptidase [Legionella maioricensis]